MNIKVLDMFKRYDKFGIDRLDELIEFDDYLKSGAIKEILAVHSVVNIGAITTSLGYIHYNDDALGKLEELLQNGEIDELLYTLDEIMEIEMLEEEEEEDYIDAIIQENYIYVDEGKYIGMIELVDAEYPELKNIRRK